jgi:hypothetical protein
LVLPIPLRRSLAAETNNNTVEKVGDMTAEAMRLHPDLAELRAKYEVAVETPVARVVDGFTFWPGSTSRSSGG